MRLSIEKGKFLCLPGRMFFLSFVIIFLSAISMATAQSAGSISVSPASYDFGSASQSQTFTLSNTGDADLAIGIISLTGTDTAEFEIQNDNCSGQTVIPSGTCTVDAVFSPISAGSKSANLSIPSDDPDTSILDVPLSGTGDDGVLSAPANFSSSIEECTTSIFGTSCTVSLSWTGVNAASGYKLYYGFSSGSYNSVDLGNATSVTFDSVPEGTYYLAISAYDSNDNESDKSDEIVLTVGETSIPTNFSATVSDCIDTFGITSCTVSLSWTGVSGPSGYYLYYGFSSANYAGSIDVGDVDSVDFTGIVDGTYYLALTAYDSEGVESGGSDELILEVGSGGNGNGNGNDNEDNGNDNDDNGNDNDEDNGNDNDDNSVTICHKPGTSAEKTLSLPESALEAHLGHGDYIGSCEDDEDNGNDNDDNGNDNVDDGGSDGDGDGVVDDIDNCPDTSNADQLDADDGGVGDVCEADSDE